MVKGMALMLVMALLAAAGLNGSVAPLFTSDNNSVPNAVVVKAVEVGVYWDSECSDRVSSIDWDVVEPGSVENVTVFVRNEGNAAASLSMNTTNWNPSKASDFITLSWDYGGQTDYITDSWNDVRKTIEPNEVIQVTLILSVSPSIEGVSTFSFDIVIVGSG